MRTTAATWLDARRLARALAKQTDAKATIEARTVGFVVYPTVDDADLFHVNKTVVYPKSQRH